MREPYCHRSAATGTTPKSGAVRAMTRAIVGAAFRRPLLIGLIFIFGWETIVTVIPGNLKRLTVAYYLEGLVPHAMPNDTAVRLLQSIFRDVPGLVESLISLAVIAIACLWLAGRSVAGKEYVLEQ